MRHSIAILLCLLPSAARADITSNLRAHYALDDATGTTATDSSGNGKHGTLAGEPTWTNGRIGWGVELDGVDQCLELPTALGIDNQSAVTIALWFKPASLTSGAMLFSHRASANERVELALGATGYSGGPDDIECILSTGSTADGSTTQNIIRVGRWHHCCMVFNGSASGNANRLKFYLNGQQVPFLDDAQNPPQPTFHGTIPATTTNNAAQVTYIGARSGSSLFLNGVVDDVRIYARALSASDVVELVNWQTTKFSAHFPTGGLPDYRVVAVDGDELHLAASDSVRFGFTGPTTGGCRSIILPGGDTLVYSTTDQSHALGTGPRQKTVLLEADDDSSIAAGDPVYQAGDGRVSDTGTIRVGVANRKVQVTGPELWSVLLD